MSNIKIIAISDIHGRTNYDRRIVDALSSADLIIIAGDITDFGGRNDANFVVNEIKAINQNVFAVPGNCDRPEVIDFLKSEGINLHGEIKKFKGILFFGMGGSGITPFNTPQEYAEDEFERILSTYEKHEGINVFVSHMPPLNTKVDKTFMGMHVGSKKVREFIENHQPHICICGHIHEARNIDRIGKTLIVNPGTFPQYYAVIEINKQIQINLVG